MRVVDAGRAEALLDYPSLIDRLQGAFREGCEAPLRHRHEIGPAGSMLIKPAWRRNGPIVVKVANVFPGNAAAGIPAVQASVLLFDGATGAPLAAIDGRTLTNRRTAAASALAARHLVRAEASAHLVIGTGQLAPELARAHAAVRPISETLIWGRNPVRAAAVAETLAAEGMAATAAGDLAKAVGRADVVSCATLATSPLVRGAWLKPGAHLDLVGGPDMREADDEAAAACRLFVDSREGALAEAGDLIRPSRRNFERGHRRRPRGTVPRTMFRLVGGEDPVQIRRHGARGSRRGRIGLVPLLTADRPNHRGLRPFLLPGFLRANGLRSSAGRRRRTRSRRGRASWAHAAVRAVSSGRFKPTVRAASGTARKPESVRGSPSGERRGTGRAAWRFSFRGGGAAEGFGGRSRTRGELPRTEERKDERQRPHHLRDRHFGP